MESPDYKAMGKIRLNNNPIALTRESRILKAFNVAYIGNQNAWPKHI
jgi:hypothetical protein